MIKKFVKKIKVLITFKSLVAELSKRDFYQRYKGSYLGYIWAIINPLVMLSVYSFIFVIVFKNKWGEVGIDSNATYTLMIFSGLIPFYIFSESVNKSLNVLVMNSNYIKKVVIPVEVLPISLVVSTTVNQIFALGLLILGKIIFLDTPNWTLIFIPLILIPLFIISLGSALIFSAIGVFVRDVAQMVSLIINILFYVSPIFYSSTMVPAKFRFVTRINPLTPIIDMWRDVVIKGQMFGVVSYLTYLFFSILFLIGSFGIFYYFRKGFADVV